MAIRGDTRTRRGPFGPKRERRQQSPVLRERASTDQEGRRARRERARTQGWRRPWRWRCRGLTLYQAIKKTSMGSHRHRHEGAPARPGTPPASATTLEPQRIRLPNPSIHPPTTIRKDVVRPGASPPGKTLESEAARPGKRAGGTTAHGRRAEGVGRGVLPPWLTTGARRTHGPAPDACPARGTLPRASQLGPRSRPAKARGSAHTRWQSHRWQLSALRSGGSGVWDAKAPSRVARERFLTEGASSPTHCLPAGPMEALQKPVPALANGSVRHEGGEKPALPQARRFASGGSVPEKSDSAPFASPDPPHARVQPQRGGTHGTRPAKSAPRSPHAVRTATSRHLSPQGGPACLPYRLDPAGELLTGAAPQRIPHRLVGNRKRGHRSASGTGGTTLSASRKHPRVWRDALARQRRGRGGGVGALPQPPRRGGGVLSRDTGAERACPLGQRTPARRRGEAEGGRALWGGFPHPCLPPTTSGKAGRREACERRPSSGAT